MSHKEPIDIGPPIIVNGRQCFWVEHDLMSPGFNKVSTVEVTHHVRTDKYEYSLIVYEYHNGYCYVKTTQILPMATTMEEARRMAIPILSLLEDSGDDKPKR